MSFFLVTPCIITSLHLLVRFSLIAFIISFISDAPQVSLRLGRTLDADNIRTGHDVYFECDVKANPPALRLEWLHNVSIQYL